MKKSFYAIIPAFVRYDKELSSTSKLIYAEITALCNEKGYCWATNNYFSELFSISIRQVQNVLKQLCDKNYIKIIIEKGTNRKIFILDYPTHEINFVGVRKKLQGSPEENFTHNNIINNKININNNNEEEDFVELFDYDWLNCNDND